MAYRKILPLLCAVSVWVFTGTASCAAGIPDAKVCRNLIASSFFHHTYERVCAREGGVGVRQADRFAKMGCTGVLQDEELKQTATNVLQSVKTEMDKAEARGNDPVRSFCTEHISEYNQVLEFLQSLE